MPRAAGSVADRPRTGVGSRRAPTPTTRLAGDASRRSQPVATRLQLALRRGRRDPGAIRRVDLPWAIAIEDEHVKPVRHDAVLVAPAGIGSKRDGSRGAFLAMDMQIVEARDELGRTGTHSSICPPSWNGRCSVPSWPESLRRCSQIRSCWLTAAARSCAFVLLSASA
jgi:hypothetical protein